MNAKSLALEVTGRTLYFALGAVTAAAVIFTFIV